MSEDDARKKYTFTLFLEGSIRSSLEVTGRRRAVEFDTVLEERLGVSQPSGTIGLIASGSATKVLASRVLCWRVEPSL